MPSDEAPSSDTTQRRVAPKRKRETQASLAAKARQNNTPNAYSRRSPPRENSRPPARRSDDDDGDQSPPRKLKRPGGGSRIAAANREAAERERKQREEETRRAVAERQLAGAEIIANHYNAVPERGREWRQSESKISGLRSLNNWIKSTLIQKFSQPEFPTPDMKVLDMACGKGGDLGKWKKAPQVPVLYVGCDIASVSIGDAQKRYEEDLAKNRGRTRMEAHFYVHDTFGRTLYEIPVIRNVGFNPNAGPGPAVIQGGMINCGFDVVSMMFALHYSFESEELARGMLRNVSGALKKGGRFIGVMPNSDVISSHLKLLLAKESSGKTPVDKTPAGGNGALSSTKQVDDDDDWNPEKPSEPNAETEDGEWDPEKPSEPSNEVANGDDDDDWDPEKPSEPVQELPGKVSASTEEKPATNGDTHAQVVSDLPDLEWKNDIYSVRFPRNQPLTKKPLPRDGIFRPPFGWKYHYHLVEAVEAPEFVVPWEAFRALAEDYGLELMYRKGFREVFEDESTDRELGMLAERMKVLDRDRSKPNGGLLVRDQEMEAASFYHAFCFYKT